MITTSKQQEVFTKRKIERLTKAFNEGKIIEINSKSNKGFEHPLNSKYNGGWLIITQAIYIPIYCSPDSNIDIRIRPAGARYPKEYVS